MLNLIVITTLAQFLPVYEEEFNLTLPDNLTTTLEPTTFIDDTSGDLEPIPKKGKKMKTASFRSNSNLSFEEDSPDIVAANVFIAGTVGMICIALLAGLYSITKRKNGYQMINNKRVNTYGTLGDGTW
jgi:hypothetical protein